MSKLKERLDLLRAEIQKEDFLNGKGLSNEVNIRIFCKRCVIYQLRTASRDRRYKPIKFERVDRSREFADIPFDIS